MPEQMSKAAQTNPELLSKIFELGYNLPFPTSHADCPVPLHPELSGHFNMNMQSLDAIGADLSSDSGQMCAYLAGAFTRLAAVGTVSFGLIVATVQGANYFMDDNHQNLKPATVTAPVLPASAPDLSRK